MEPLKKANPQSALYYKNVVKAEKTGEREVTFTFDVKGNRELPHDRRAAAVLPKHYWEANGANGEPRDLDKIDARGAARLGAYKIKSFEPGRKIIYERVADYWAKDLPVSQGQWNFDEITLRLLPRPSAGFEAFKSGQIDFWTETERQALGDPVRFRCRQEGPRQEGSCCRTSASRRMQAFVFNPRRKQFQDPRVRQAFNLAFNFEARTRSCSIGQYVRVAQLLRQFGARAQRAAARAASWKS